METLLRVKKKKEDRIVEFFIEEGKDNTIKLFATCDDLDRKYEILQISKRGVLLYGLLPDRLGIETDVNRKINVL